MTVLVGAGAYWTPVGVEAPSEYVPTAEAREAAQAALDLIQVRHEADCRRCALCGQLCNRVDGFGLCSKTSIPHAKWRQQVRGQEKAVDRRSRYAQAVRS